MRDFHVGLRICLEKSFPFKMLSTVLLSQRSYPAMLLAEQPVHQRLNISGPLVQGNGFLNSSRAPQVESKLSHACTTLPHTRCYPHPILTVKSSIPSHERHGLYLHPSSTYIKKGVGVLYILQTKNISFKKIFK